MHNKIILESRNNAKLNESGESWNVNIAEKSLKLAVIVNI